MLFNINKNAISYSATTMAATMMHSVFQFYYVQLFLEHYRITPYWFNFAQIFYMIWNAINDPLFGYFQDYSNLDCLKHRRLNILYGAPLFVASFLLPWFDWRYPDSADWLTGMHLLVTLACYDCMFTFVLLAQCSIFAEISRNESERQTVLMHTTVASIIGSSSVFVAEYISDHMKKIHALQINCCVIAAISLVLLTYSGKNVKVVVDRSKSKDKKEDESWGSAFHTTKEIFSNKNFVCFVTMNFCQVFHSTYIFNFFGIFRGYLIGEGALPSFIPTFMAGSAFVLPSVMVLLFNSSLKKYGSYHLILCSFFLKILMGIFFYIFGLNVIIIVLFMVLDSTFVGATFNLFNLCISDVIDEDQEKHKRAHPVSSMMFGLNALVTKPAQSIAPMVIVYILKQYGYKNAKESQSSQEYAELKEKMHVMMALLPIIIGLLQIFCWRIYSLRKKE